MLWYHYNIYSALGIFVYNLLTLAARTNSITISAPAVQPFYSVRARLTC